MKRLLFALVLSTLIVSCAKNSPKVLLFMRYGSPDLEFMLEKEVRVMKDTLERSGYKVVIATQDGSNFLAGSARVKADLSLAEVDVADYAGFILPCMAAGTSLDNQISAESIEMSRKAISAGKPVAAQTGSIWVLASAGLLKGKKYASTSPQQGTSFAGATYGGRGVVRDGLVITSAICPYMSRMLKAKDETEQLTLALVDAMKGKK